MDCGEVLLQSKNRLQDLRTVVGQSKLPKYTGLYITGSTARGNLTIVSDIDLLVFDPNVDLADLSQIQERLPFVSLIYIDWYKPKINFHIHEIFQLLYAIPLMPSHAKAKEHFAVHLKHTILSIGFNDIFALRLDDIRQYQGSSHFTKYRALSATNGLGGDHRLQFIDLLIFSLALSIKRLPTDILLQRKAIAQPWKYLCALRGAYAQQTGVNFENHIVCLKNSPLSKEKAFDPIIIRQMLRDFDLRTSTLRRVLHKALLQQAENSPTKRR